jgi:hypothetical protein
LNYRVSARDASGHEVYSDPYTITVSDCGTPTDTPAPTSTPIYTPTFTALPPQACGRGVQLDIVPASPTEDDTVQVVYSSDWPDACVPSYRAHEVIDNVIRVDAAIDYMPPRRCPLVVTHWVLAVAVGKLPSGSYRADFYVTGTDGYGTVLCATRSFTVLEPPLTLTCTPTPPSISTPTGTPTHLSTYLPVIRRN